MTHWTCLFVLSDFGDYVFVCLSVIYLQIVICFRISNSLLRPILSVKDFCVFLRCGIHLLF